MIRSPCHSRKEIKMRCRLTLLIFMFIVHDIKDNGLNLIPAKFQTEFNFDPPADTAVSPSPHFLGHTISCSVMELNRFDTLISSVVKCIYHSRKKKSIELHSAGSRTSQGSHGNSISYTALMYSKKNPITRKKIRNSPQRIFQNKGYRIDLKTHCIAIPFM